jgi:glycosyltransferase involved in cell wall biosynthesis
MLNVEKRSCIWVAAAADSTNPNGFGGLPYHLVDAGRSLGVIEGGFPFRPDSLKTRISRGLWNTSMLLRTGRYGGFQYSDTFLNQIWASAPRPSGNYTVLNIFQLYPEAEMTSSYCKFFYLDQTLYDLFKYYSTSSQLPHAWRTRVLERERAQYHASEGIIFRSHWAASRAIEFYDLPQQKVHVVLPGANISRAALNVFDAEKRPTTYASVPLRLVFIGKEWKRKGLDRLLSAMRLAQSDGARLSLTVIGTRSEDVPKYLTQGISVTWVGFFNKSLDPLGFARLVAKHDVGVLLSRTEAGGVSLREFGRLGLPVLAPDTGGSPEFAMSDDAKLFAPTDSHEKIAQALVDLVADLPALTEMKAMAWKRRNEFDWRVAVMKLADLL